MPAAAVSTLVTNPLTFGPLYYAAYKLGHWVGGAPVHVDPPSIEANGADVAGLPREEVRLWQRLRTVGKPLLLGLTIIASITGLLSYALVTLAWLGWTWYKRRGRRQR